MIDPKAGERVLPTFYSDNYVSVLPGEQKTVVVDYDVPVTSPKIAVRGWNMKERMVSVR
ncbi:hypothetical protein [Mucilaginibacter antarcticus]|uniref:hypothetical protein n=1 Tax=Mucilaginibacter antarcticus TaxID=1855725 RepID=UPI00363FE749